MDLIGFFSYGKQYQISKNAKDIFNGIPHLLIPLREEISVDPLVVYWSGHSLSKQSGVSLIRSKLKLFGFDQSENHYLRQKLWIVNTPCPTQLHSLQLVSQLVCLRCRFQHRQISLATRLGKASLIGARHDSNVSSIKTKDKTK